MSRIGKKEIKIPDKVKVEIKSDIVKVTGPNGTLEESIPADITVREENGEIYVERANDEKDVRSKHGLIRQLIHNMVVGVSQGFTKELEILGVGYRCQMKGANVLNLQLGYSNPVDFELPKEIKCEVDGTTKIKLTSHNKYLLGQVAANIREIRPPEVYKGKGVRYKDEYVRRKAGKTTK